ncbi:GNAT family N-acetyltransferase [Peptoniphilus raoultii]|uniref:GNAT family N-acetyltransferase n=1 Tax=Peptoniphilus raoultii TaxID=1776387 RepID=UPI000A95438D|nr:GNAT family N-acetyltransferase [Peptoniphilus raoultii]
MEIKEVISEKDYKDFADLVYKIYEKNKYYIYPLYDDYIEYIKGKNNRLASCPHKLFLAIKNGEVVGRILAYIDEEINKFHNSKVGYISQYEAFDGNEISKGLLDACVNFFKGHDIKNIRGPVSLPDGEDNRGFLINAFDKYPSVMNVYNMDYYNKQFLAYGFEFYHDVFAYKADKFELAEKIEKLSGLIPQVQKRYSYYTKAVDLKNNLEGELEAVYKILKEAMPESWEDFLPITKDDVEGIFKQMQGLVIEDLVVIAWNNENRPIGFALSLPDYNEILKNFKGKLGLINKIKFLFLKNKIQRVRMFVLMVIPEYRNKGVTSSIYLHVFKNAVKKGYTILEGSTIWDFNKPMINDIEKFGAKKDKTYRIYQKNI